MKIQIEPIQVAFQTEANFIQLRQGGYVLGSNEACRVRLLFYKDGDLIDDQKIVEIPKELVILWNDNDQVLIDYVISTLGLVVVPPQLNTI